MLPRWMPMNWRIARRALRDMAGDPERCELIRAAFARINELVTSLSGHQPPEGEPVHQAALEALLSEWGYSAELIPNLDLNQVIECLEALTIRRAALPVKTVHPRRRQCRLSIKGVAVHLDGNPLCLGDTSDARAAAVCFLTHLLRAKGNWLSGSEVDEAEEQRGGASLAGTRWDRVRRRLPESVRELIESSPMKGFRLAPVCWRN
jgi:hypothetical protein